MRGCSSSKPTDHSTPRFACLGARALHACLAHLRRRPVHAWFVLPDTVPLCCAGTGRSRADCAATNAELRSVDCRVCVGTTARDASQLRRGNACAHVRRCVVARAVREGVDMLWGNCWGMGGAAGRRWCRLLCCPLLARSLCKPGAMWRPVPRALVAYPQGVANDLCMFLPFRPCSWQGGCVSARTPHEPRRPCMPHDTSETTRRRVARRPSSA